MNNNLILKDTNIVEQIKNNIKDDLSKIKLNFKKNILVPLNLYNLEEHLTELKSYTNFEISDIIDLITIDYLFFFSYSINKFEFCKTYNFRNFEKWHKNKTSIYIQDFRCDDTHINL